MQIITELLVGLLILQAILLLFPIVVRVGNVGANNASNNALWITLSKRLDYPVAAVLAQELYEMLQRRNVINLVRAICSKRYRRQLEIIGHEIEVQASAEWYDMDKFKTRKEEAYIMALKYPDFKGYSPEHIRDQMALNADLAADWLHQHKNMILKLADKAVTGRSC